MTEQGFRADRRRRRAGLKHGECEAVSVRADLLDELDGDPRERPGYDDPEHCAVVGEIGPEDEDDEEEEED